MTRELVLTRGYVALVDDEDFARLSAHSWYPQPRPGGQVYVYRQQHRRTIYLHRDVLGAVAGTEVDHVNRDTLDNRRSNLRVATRSQNEANTRKRPGHSSRYKGVSWHRVCHHWVARVKVDGRTSNLGCFETEEQAASAYDLAAVAAFGPFARTNRVSRVGAA